MKLYTTELGTAECIQDFKKLYSGIDIPLTQTKTYAEWQIQNKREVIWLRIYREKTYVGYALCVRYTIPNTDTYYWYTPYGPILSLGTDDSQISVRTVIKSLSQTISASIRKHEAKNLGTLVFIRTDATLHTQSQYKNTPLLSYPLSIGSYFQPRAEWQVSLKQSYKTILEKMHHKTRYSIKLSLKKHDLGILSYEIITGEKIRSYQKIFEKLMRETALRDRFTMHDHSYYSAIFNSLQKSKSGFLINIYKQGSIHSPNDTKLLLVSNLIVYTDTSAYYLFGTSSNEDRNLMPAYLAQWKALERAHMDGKTWYNFGGISTRTFPRRNWQGITDFKMKFGGEARIHPFMYDIPVSKLRYTLYTLTKIISYFKSYIRSYVSFSHR